jgi:hypothetical protein
MAGRQLFGKSEQLPDGETERKDGTEREED